MLSLLKNPVFPSSLKKKLILPRYAVLITLFLILVTNVSAQKLPLGYIEYYSHSCTNTDLFNSLSADDSASWKIVAEKPVNVLRILSKDSISINFPQSRAMFSKWIWGDFILRFDLRQVPADTCEKLAFTFLGAARNVDTYYAYSFTSDSLKFFYINDSTVEKIKSHPLGSLKKKWNTIIVQRNILNRSFSFTINNSSEKINFSHPDLVMGFIGFGNHSGTSYVKNIKLWAPTVIDEKVFLW